MWTNDAANVSQDFDWHLQTSSAAKKMSQKRRTKLDFYELQASMKMSFNIWWYPHKGHHWLQNIKEFLMIKQTEHKAYNKPQPFTDTLRIAGF